MSRGGFVESFLLPLVAGGVAHVGAPLGLAGLARLRALKVDPGLAAEVFAARSAVASELLYDPIPPQLDLPSLRLAIAVHDLLFLFHPGAAGLAVRGKRIAEVARFAAALAALPATTDDDMLVARHTILHLVPGLGRTDVRVSFWAGRREFHGEEPPRRLTAWPNMRRVHEERWRVGCFAEAASHAQGGEVVRALLDASPLTDLLNPVRIEPRLVLGSRRAVLARPALCRLVIYAWLDGGIDRVGGALATAAIAELDGREPEVGRFVCALIAHLHLCTILAPTAQVPTRERRPAPRILVGTDLALRDFYGLFAALHRAIPRLAAPADVHRDPRLGPRVAEHAAACALACGELRVGELAALVARTGGPIALSNALP